MGIDLKKGTPGLDLKKKPASTAPVPDGAKGLDLKKGKPGLDLRKTPSAGSGSNPPKYGNVPPPSPIIGNDMGKRKGKWGWFLLIIPLAAIVWAVWPKTGSDKPGEVANGKEIVQNLNGNEADASVATPGVPPGSESSNTLQPGTSSQPQKLAGQSDNLGEGQLTSPAETKKADAVTAKVIDKKTPVQTQTEPIITDYSSFTHNRTPVKQDAIKQVLQFGFNDKELDAVDKNTLDQFIANYPKDSAPAIRIDGYACNIGQEYANYAVSQERAINVQNYLKNNGIGANVQILVSAYGSQNPIGDNSTSQGRAQNRRVAVSFE